MKARDLREQSAEELQELLTKERAALYKARRDLVFRQMTDTASLKIRRHNIARILTILGEKGKAVANG